MSSVIKEGYFYTKQHEWAKEENGLLVIGISDYAQSALGDIVYVDIKQPGAALNAGDALGTIESVKAAEDVYAPVAGKIEAANTDINKQPESVNKDAYGSWFVKLSGYDKEGLKGLMDAAAYRTFVESLDH